MMDACEPDFDYANSPTCSSNSGNFLPKQDSSGTLRTKISMHGKTPSVVTPFYLIKPDLPRQSPLVGSMNLLEYYGLDSALAKFAGGRKVKESISSFLPQLPGLINTPGSQDNSSLNALMQRTIVTKSIEPLQTVTTFAGFRLAPGAPLEEYRILMGVGGAEKRKHKRKHKRSNDDSSADESDKKSKKARKDDDIRDKDKKKKKKKDKKKKVNREDEGPGSQFGSTHEF